MNNGIIVGAYMLAAMAGICFVRGIVTLTPIRRK